MNVPNRLTLLRVIMIPFFIFFMLVDLTDQIGNAGKYIAAVIFIVASLTDWFDGYLARKNNLVTNFGKFMDPLADKLLVCSALICLLAVGRLEAWIVLVIISREFIISGFRLVASDNGVVIAASYWGKFKTAFQMVMIILLIFAFELMFFEYVTIAVKYIAVVLTIISLVDYLIKNWKVIGEGEI